MQGKQIVQLLEHAVNLAQKAATIQPPRSADADEQAAQLETEARRQSTLGTSSRS